MKSFDDAYFSKIIIPHRLITTIRQIGEYKGRQDLYKQQAPEMLENLRHVAMIQSTESSNRLEGITADIKRIKALVEEKTTPANRPEVEIAGYRDVLNTIHSNYKNIPFTQEYMRLIHKEFNTLIKEQILDPVIMTPLYILDFLCIHPFLDGNGRM